MPSRQSGDIANNSRNSPGSTSPRTGHLTFNVTLNVVNADHYVLPFCGGSDDSTSVTLDKNICFQGSLADISVYEGVENVYIAGTGHIHLFDGCEHKLKRTYTISFNGMPFRGSLFFSQSVLSSFSISSS